jgi:hypothetical protein
MPIEPIRFSGRSLSMATRLPGSARPNLARACATRKTGHWPGPVATKWPECCRAAPRDRGSPCPHPRSSLLGPASCAWGRRRAQRHGECSSQPSPGARSSSRTSADTVGPCLARRDAQRRDRLRRPRRRDAGSRAPVAALFLVPSRRSEGAPSGHWHVPGGGLARGGAPVAINETGLRRKCSARQRGEPHPARGVPEERLTP